MVRSYDLYGQAMLDRFEGRRHVMRFERDDGYLDTADVSALFSPYRAWPRSERQAIRFAKGRVLDIGCGPGRVALYLQRKGHAVTGVEVSAQAAEVARRRGVRDVQIADGCALPFRGGAFDTLVLYGNNFGICGGWDETRAFLQRARRVTSRAGRVIASSRVPGTWIDRHAAYVKRNVRRGRPPGILRLRIRYRGKTGGWFPLLIVSPDDLLRLCEPLGWDVRHVFLEPGDPTSYAFVAEKRRVR